MTFSVGRRSFVSFLASLVPGYKLFPFDRFMANGISLPQSQSRTRKSYVCPPCGLSCDKLTFDQPGDCPNCGMKLISTNGGEDSPPTVAILLFNGAEIIDFAGPWEVFGTAGFLVHTVAENLEPHTMVFGQKVMPDYTFEKSPKADVLLIPGGVLGEATKSDRLIQWIRAKSRDVSHVMSVCTGAFLLARAGLLDGLTATTTYGMEEELAKAGRNIKIVYPERFVDAGKIITTAGLSSGIDGALHLVSKMIGAGAAQSAALNMEYRWSAGTKYSRAAMADRYLPDGLQFGKANLRGAQAKMISTEGDTNNWETRILVSDPKSPPEIIDVVRTRIQSNTSHTRDGVLIKPPGKAPAGSSQIKWTFIDAQGFAWRGAGLVDPSPEQRGKFILTLKLTRSRTSRSV